MPLPDSQHDALVAHLAERFPSWGARAEVARRAGLGEAQLSGDPRAVWGGLIRAAEDRDGLAELLGAAARQRPEDALLARLHAEAREGTPTIPPAEDPRAWIRSAVLAGAVVVLLGVVALVADGLGLGTPTPEATAPDPALTAEADTPTADAPEAEPAPGAEPVPFQAAAAPSPPAAPATSPPEPAAPPAEPAAPPAEAASQAPPAAAGAPEAPAADGPCAGPADRVVGYAYAGDAAPEGPAWVTPRSLNVRRDYPRRANGWSARAPVVCVLPRGARVALRSPPIPVDGGAFWVPVHGGSVSRP